MKELAFVTEFAHCTCSHVIFIVHYIYLPFKAAITPQRRSVASKTYKEQQSELHCRQKSGLSHSQQ